MRMEMERPTSTIGRTQVIFLGGMVSAVMALVLLFLAYLPL